MIINNRIKKELLETPIKDLVFLIHNNFSKCFEIKQYLYWARRRIYKKGIQAVKVSDIHYYAGDGAEYGESSRDLVIIYKGKLVIIRESSSGQITEIVVSQAFDILVSRGVIFSGEPEKKEYTILNLIDTFSLNYSSKSYRRI